MKLTIYNGRTAAKTYEADKYDLMFGTLEDVCKVVKLDELKEGTNAEIIKMAIGVVTESTDLVKDLMKDIFEGITDEELKHATVTEMAQVLIEVVKYTSEQLSKGLTRKN